MQFEPMFKHFIYSEQYFIMFVLIEELEFGNFLKEVTRSVPKSSRVTFLLLKGLNCAEVFKIH